MLTKRSGTFIAFPTRTTVDFLPAAAAATASSFHLVCHLEMLLDAVQVLVPLATAWQCAAEGLFVTGVHRHDFGQFVIAQRILHRPRIIAVALPALHSVFVGSSRRRSWRSCSCRRTPARAQLPPFRRWCFRIHFSADTRCPSAVVVCCQTGRATADSKLCKQLVMLSRIGGRVSKETVDVGQGQTLRLRQLLFLDELPVDFDMLRLDVYDQLQPGTELLATT